MPGATEAGFTCRGDCLDRHRVPVSRHPAAAALVSPKTAAQGHCPEYLAVRFLAAAVGCSNGGFIASLIADAAVLTVHSEEGLKVSRMRCSSRQRTIFMPLRDQNRGDDGVPPVPCTPSDPCIVRRQPTAIATGRPSLPRSAIGPTSELRIVGTAPSRPDKARRQRGRHPPENQCRIPRTLPLGRCRGAGAKAQSARIWDYRRSRRRRYFGVPVVVTDLGGMRGYFSERELRYAPPSDPDAMREAIKAVARDETSAKMVERAQRRMIEDGLTSRGFARRHAQLSRDLLDEAMTGERNRLKNRR